MQRHSGEHAFTLIELLTVIVVATILFGIAFPVYIGVMERARKTQAKNDLTQIVSAVNAYYTEYGKYPVNAATNTTNAFFGTGTTPTGATSYGNNDVLIDVLRNNTSSTNNSAIVALLNPRQIVFIQPPAVQHNTSPKSGVISNGAVGVLPPLIIGAWYDPWGSPYNVMIDWNYDNSLTNPYSDPTPPGPPGGTPLYIGVAAWAFGKNGILGGDLGGTIPAGFTSEGGTASNFSGSGDVISWQ